MRLLPPRPTKITAFKHVIKRVTNVGARRAAVNEFIITIFISLPPLCSPPRTLAQPPETNVMYMLQYNVKVHTNTCDL